MKGICFRINETSLKYDISSLICLPCERRFLLPASRPLVRPNSAKTLPLRDRQAFIHTKKK